MQLELDDKGGAKELAFHRLKTAKEDLKAARLNFESGQYRTTNNRAYYAVFRAISACLALEFKANKQHAFSRKRSAEKSAERRKCAMPVIMMIFISSPWKMQKNS